MNPIKGIESVVIYVCLWKIKYANPIKGIERPYFFRFIPTVGVAMNPIKGIESNQGGFMSTYTSRKRNPIKGIERYSPLNLHYS